MRERCRAFSRETPVRAILQYLMSGLAMAALASIAPASAQTFPTKAVTIVVLTAPGGVLSTLTRIISEPLARKWGQSVIVENKPGAGGLIASEYVSHAKPDGYTILMGSDAISTYALFMKATKFDVERDLSPISIATYAPFILQINFKVPAKTFEQFIAYAKANPGQLNQGIIGASQQMLDAILFGQKTGVDIAQIPYAGGVPAIAALLANDIQLYFGTYSTSAVHFQTGALIPVAVGGEQRQRSLPNVPTLKELGVDMISGFW
jgi:tripartite-type tricarboxylate transporter receptor subunit TctC